MASVAAHTPSKGIVDYLVARSGFCLNTFIAEGDHLNLKKSFSYRLVLLIKTYIIIRR